MRNCQSYLNGTVCADGFIQKPICRGVHGCHACGSLSDAETPNCQTENPGKPHFNEGGSPLYYKVAAFCIMPNCRNRAPADQPFCAQHRDDQHSEREGHA